MAETIEHPTRGRLCGPRPRTLRLVMRYGSDDPYAVALCFPGPLALAGGLIVEDGGAVEDGVRWLVSRELLETGSRRPAGEGDFGVRPGVGGTVRLDFRSAHGVAVFRIGAADLRGFLDATYRIVPPGTERTLIDWPGTAAEFLSRRR